MELGIVQGMTKIMVFAMIGMMVGFAKSAPVSDDGIREYDRSLTHLCGKGGRVPLSIPAEFFHTRGDGR